MSEDFRKIAKDKSDSELEIIAKDHLLYSLDKRIIALDELKNRNKISDELIKLNLDLINQKREEDELDTSHKLTFNDLIPHKNYFVTPSIIYINVIIFGLMLISGVHFFEPKVNSLIEWGGNLRGLTINGQFYRLLSSIFLHAGIFHLAFNLYALLYVGSLLEKAIGENKFVFAYLTSGIIASVTSLIINENIVSVGASGAIFGLFGVLLAILLTKKSILSGISTKELLPSVGLFIFYNIFYGFTQTGIDNAAHIGGLLSGFLIGLTFVITTKHQIKSVFIYSALVLFFGTISIFALNNTSDRFSKFDNIMQEFAMNEEKALWMHRENLSYIPNEKIDLYKDRMNSEGIKLWQKNISILSDLQDENYPHELNQILNLLIEYSELRMKSCVIMHELIDNESSELSNELKNTFLEIENKLIELEKLNNRQYHI